MSMSLIAMPPCHPSPPNRLGRVRVRRVRPDDAAKLVAFYRRLSPESWRRRFLGYATIGADMLGQLCGPDHLHAEGFVAELVGSPGDGQIVGHLCLEPVEQGAIEVAVAVADAYQRMGIGRRLRCGLSERRL